MGSRLVLGACIALFAFPAATLEAGKPKELSVGLDSPRVLLASEARLILIGIPKGGGTDKCQIVAINPADGSELWRTGVKKGREAIESIEGNLLCIHGDGAGGEDALIDLETGQKKLCPPGARVVGVSSGTLVAVDTSAGKVVRLNRDGSVVSAWISGAQFVRQVLAHEKGCAATLPKELVALDAEGKVAWRWAYPEGSSVRGESLRLWKDTLALSNVESDQPSLWMLDLATGKLRATIDFRTCSPGLTYSHLRPRDDCEGSGRFLLVSGMVGAKGSNSAHSATLVIDVQSGKLERQVDEAVMVMSPEDVLVVAWSQTTGEVGKKDWKMETGSYGFDLGSGKQVWRKHSIPEHSLTPAHHCGMDMATKSDWRYGVFSNKDGKRLVSIPVPKDLAKETLERLRSAFEGKEIAGDALLGQHALPGEVFVFRFERIFVVSFADAGRMAQVDLEEKEEVVGAGLMGEKACIVTSASRALLCPTTK